MLTNSVTTWNIVLFV